MQFFFFKYESPINKSVVLSSDTNMKITQDNASKNYKSYRHTEKLHLLKINLHNTLTSMIGQSNKFPRNKINQTNF